MSEVEVRSSAVTLSHGLPELPLGPEAVENDGVDHNDKNLNDDFDDAADKSPVLNMLALDSSVRTDCTHLKAADEGIGDIVLEEMSSFIVDARPAPHIFVVVLRFTLIEYCCTYSPHDDTEDEESNGEDSVVSGNLFGSVMAMSTVGDHDDDRHQQRDSTDRKQQNLGPDLGVLSPCWKSVSLGKMLCSPEDGESGGDHRDDDETASKVDTTKEDLCDSYS